MRQIINTCVTLGLTLLLAGFTSHLSAQPMLWKAEVPNQTLYLMGTVHLGSPETSTMSKPVLNALNQADALIVEAKLDEPITFPNSNSQPTTRSTLSPDEINQLESIASVTKLSAKQLLSLPPWQVALTLQQWQFASLGFEAEYGVEAQLMAWAEVNNLSTLGLESLQFQIDLIAKQPDNGLDMLKQTINEWANSQASIRCLIDSWQAGDDNNLDAILQAEAFNEHFYHAFIYERNRNWASTLAEDARYKEGIFFVAVGALHLVGDDSVIELLSKRGYTIERLTLPGEADCSM
ncbi:TraB/GumN family protein [Vibrio maritimus]|uniref:TraB/GumN family protein n=1 Tax=Vibrio maritimus TaxID=990268 RepID=UPI001F2CDD61|nr:TraB/GumN family protein [Vibrio maritimus]